MGWDEGRGILRSRRITTGAAAINFVAIGPLTRLRDASTLPGWNYLHK